MKRIFLLPSICSYGTRTFISSYPNDMANTYTQIHIQFVFAVKYRAALIRKEWKDRLHQYITGIIQANEHKMLRVNNIPDHIHIFLGMRPIQSIASLVQNVKTESSEWIKNNKFCKAPFAWQQGYGAFSYNSVDKYAFVLKAHP